MKSFCESGRIDINIDGLSRLLSDFHKITGQRIGVFDANFNIVLEYPYEHTRFCRVIRDSSVGTQKCKMCDDYGMKEALRAGETVQYRCHAGLLELCAPVIDSGRTLGFLMLGQVLYSCDFDSQWAVVKRGCESADGKILYFKDIAALYAAFEQIKRVEKDYLQSTAHLLTAIVGYIRLEHMMKLRLGGLWEQMLSYIDRNFTSSITLSGMAEELDVSVSYICQTSKRMAGVTVGAMVMEKRIQHACKLLRETDMKIFEVAEASGILDYNYFSRVFRRKTGQSPGQYRRRYKEQSQNIRL